MDEARQGFTSRMDANLSVQGYCLTAEQSRALRFGLRFPTALCLAAVVTGLALQSAPLILALVPIGAVAGWTPRHPFDLIWNHGLRHLTGAPELPPNPRAETPRLQAGDGLASGRRDPVRDRAGHSGAGAGRDAARGLRTGDGDELLCALDAARDLVAMARTERDDDLAAVRKRQERARRTDGSRTDGERRCS
jgi:hypothetical protein